MWPPPDVVAALSSQLVVPGRAVAPEKLHVTLRFYGPVDVDRRWLGSLALPPATAQLASATAAFGRSVLHVPVAGLADLAAVVDPAPARPFVGHLTLARSRSRGRSGEDLRAAVGQEVPVLAQAPWPVDEVTLVASGAGGRYEVEERFAVGR